MAGPPPGARRPRARIVTYFVAGGRGVVAVRACRATGLLLLIAGHETTINLIGNGTLALLRDRAALDRSDNHHVAFGGGIHHCLGAALARTEGEIAIAALVRSSSRLELLEEPIRRPTFTLRGLDRLLVSRR